MGDPLLELLVWREGGRNGEGREEGMAKSVVGWGGEAGAGRAMVGGRSWVNGGGFVGWMLECGRLACGAAGEMEMEVWAREYRKYDGGRVRREEARIGDVILSGLTGKN